MNKLSFDDFVYKANSVHEKGMYEYPSQKLVNTKTKIVIKCIRGNHLFKQLPSTHLLGKGCRSCSRVDTRKTFEQFKEESYKKYGDVFDFPGGFYKTSYFKIEVKCKRCNSIYFQTPVTHLNTATGCLKCGYYQARLGILKSFEEFRERAIIIHGDKYSYFKEYYKDRKHKTAIYCNRCCCFFCKTPNGILNGGGCSSCAVNSVQVDKAGVVYKITCLHNKKSYIGITTTPIRLRFNRHFDAARRGKNKTIFGLDLNKYGYKGFKIEILQHSIASNLAVLEEYWINKLNTKNPGGYNFGSPGCGLHLKK